MEELARNWDDGEPDKSKFNSSMEAARPPLAGPASSRVEPVAVEEEEEADCELIMDIRLLLANDMEAEEAVEEAVEEVDGSAETAAGWSSRGAGRAAIFGRVGDGPRPRASLLRSGLLGERCSPPPPPLLPADGVGCCCCWFSTSLVVVFVVVLSWMYIGCGCCCCCCCCCCWEVDEEKPEVEEEEAMAGMPTPTLEEVPAVDGGMPPPADDGMAPSECWRRFCGGAAAALDDGAAAFAAGCCCCCWGRSFRRNMEAPG